VPFGSSHVAATSMANLVHLGLGGAVGTHVNHDVDVLFVGVEGAGCVTIGAVHHKIRAGIVVAVAKGTTRSVEADAVVEVVYLTVHRARAYRLGTDPPTGERESALATFAAKTTSRARRPVADADGSDSPPGRVAECPCLRGTRGLGQHDFEDLGQTGTAALARAPVAPRLTALAAVN